MASTLLKTHYPKTPVKSTLSILRYKGGDSYMGTSNKDIRTGIGFMSKKENKTSYAGEWIQDEYDGIGYIILSRNCSYVGEFTNAIRHGIGCMIFKDSEYLGEFKNGYMTGLACILEKSTGIIHKGYFVDGEKQGFGVVENRLRGYVFEGNYRDSRKHGVGLEKFKGREYVGGFRKDKKDGKGVIFKNGRLVYIGEWKAGTKAGFCQYSLGPKHYYEGMVDGDTRHGFGKMTNKGKRVVYLGEYQQNLRNGFGRLETSNSVYVGNFKKGKKHGLGYVKIDGGKETYFGYWKDDKKSGVGYSINDRTKMKGTHKRGVLHGFAIIEKNGLGSPIFCEYQNGNYIRDVDPGLCKQLYAQKFDLNEFLANCKRKTKQLEDKLDAGMAGLNFDYEDILSQLETESEELDDKLRNVKIHYYGVKFGVQKINAKLKEYSLKTRFPIPDLELKKEEILVEESLATLHRESKGDVKQALDFVLREYGRYEGGIWGGKYTNLTSYPNEAAGTNYSIFPGMEHPNENFELDYDMRHPGVEIESKIGDKPHRESEGLDEDEDESEVSDAKKMAIESDKAFQEDSDYKSGKPVSSIKFESPTKSSRRSPEKRFKKKRKPKRAPGQFGSSNRKPSGSSRNRERDLIQPKSSKRVGKTYKCEVNSNGEVQTDEDINPSRKDKIMDEILNSVQNIMDGHNTKLMDQIKGEVKHALDDVLEKNKSNLKSPQKRSQEGEFGQSQVEEPRDKKDYKNYEKQDEVEELKELHQLELNDLKQQRDELAEQNKYLMNEKERMKINLAEDQQKIDKGKDTYQKLVARMALLSIQNYTLKQNQPQAPPVEAGDFGQRAPEDPAQGEELANQIRANERIEEEKNKLAEANKIIEDENKKLKEDMIALNAQIETSNFEKGEKGKEVEAERKRVEDLEKEKNDLTQKLEDIKLRHKEELERIKNSIEGEETRKGMEVELELQELKNSIKELEDKHDTRSREKDEVERKYQEMLEKEKQLVRDMEALKKQLKGKEAIADALKKESEDKKREDDQAVKKLQTEVLQLKKQLRDKDKDISSELKKKDDEIKKIAQLKEREALRKVADREKELMRDMDQKDRELKSTQLEIGKKDREIEGLKDKLRKVEEDLKNEKGKGDDLDKKHQDELKALNDKITKLEQEIIVKGESEANLIKNLEDLKSQLKDIQENPPKAPPIEEEKPKEAGEFNQQQPGEFNQGEGEFNQQENPTAAAPPEEKQEPSPDDYEKRYENYLKNQNRFKAVKQFSKAPTPEAKHIKIARSRQNQSELYAYGNTICRLKIAGNDSLQLLDRLQSSDHDFMSLLGRKNGEMILFDMAKGDLVHMDSKYEEIHRVEGGLDKTLTGANLNYFNQSKYFIWLMSSQAVGLYNPRTRGNIEFGFFSEPLEDGDSILVVYNTELNLMIGVCNKNPDQEGGYSRIIVKGLESDLQQIGLEQVAKINICHGLDILGDYHRLIVGGTDAEGLKIACLSVSGRAPTSLGLNGSINIIEENQPKRISALKTLEHDNKFAAGFDNGLISIYQVARAYNEILLLSKIGHEQSPKTPILDLFVNETLIYVLNEGEESVQIYVLEV